MAYAEKYYLQVYDTVNGIQNRLSFYADGFGGSATELDAYGDGFRYEAGNPNGKLTDPFLIGKLTAYVKIKDATDAQLITDLLGASEGEYRLEWRKAGTLQFRGNVYLNLSETGYHYPYNAKIIAGDGIASLKGDDYSSPVDASSGFRKSQQTILEDQVDAVGFGFGKVYADTWEGYNGTAWQTNIIRDFYPDIRQIAIIPDDPSESLRATDRRQVLEWLNRRWNLRLVQWQEDWHFIQPDSYINASADFQDEASDSIADPYSTIDLDSADCVNEAQVAVKPLLPPKKAFIEYVHRTNKVQFIFPSFDTTQSPQSDTLSEFTITTSAFVTFQADVITVGGDTATVGVKILMDDGVSPVYYRESDNTWTSFDTTNEYSNVLSNWNIFLDTATMPARDSADVTITVTISSPGEAGIREIVAYLEDENIAPSKSTTVYGTQNISGVETIDIGDVPIGYGPFDTARGNIQGFANNLISQLRRAGDASGQDPQQELVERHLGHRGQSLSVYRFQQVKGYLDPVSPVTFDSKTLIPVHVWVTGDGHSGGTYIELDYTENTISYATYTDEPGTGSSGVSSGGSGDAVLDLTPDEIAQLQNINSVTITNTQWGYLGSADQAIATTDSIEFVNQTLTGYLDLTEISTPASPAATAARLYAKDDSGKTEIHMIDSNGNGHVLMQDNYEIVRNVTGAQLDKGTAVYLSGETGNVSEVSKAQADDPSTMPCTGILAEDIADNGYGRMLVIGVIEGFDTSAWNAGDDLWVSASTAGELVTTAPSVPANIEQRVGKVHVSGVGNGKIQITIHDMEGVERGTRYLFDAAQGFEVNGSSFVDSSRNVTANQGVFSQSVSMTSPGTTSGFRLTGTGVDWRMVVAADNALIFRDFNDAGNVFPVRIEQSSSTESLFIQTDQVSIGNPLAVNKSSVTAGYALDVDGDILGSGNVHLTDGAFLGVNSGVGVTYNETAGQFEFSNDNVLFGTTTQTHTGVTLGDGFDIGAEDWSDGVTDWRITSEGVMDMRSIFADSLHIEALIADIDLSLLSGRVISKSVTQVSRDFTIPIGTNDIVGGDDTADYFSVSGDLTSAITAGDTFEVTSNGTPPNENDGDYTVDSVSYDSGNDETDIYTVEDIANTVPAEGEVRFYSTLYVEDHPGNENAQVFTASDWIRLQVIDRSGGGLVWGEVWGRVSNYSDESGGEQSWRYTSYQDDSLYGSTVGAGAAATDYGQSGDGVIKLDALDTNAPFVSVETWTTLPYTAGNYTTHAMMGNLDYAPTLAEGEDPSGWGFYGDRIYLDFDANNYLFYNGTDFELATEHIAVLAGTGSLGTDFTGLRIWEDTSVHRIGGYNSDTLQWYADTDGKLYGGAGSVQIDEDGLNIEKTDGRPTVQSVYAIDWTGGAGNDIRISGYETLPGNVAQLALEADRIRFVMQGTEAAFSEGGTAGATESAWIAVNVEGTSGYIRVYATE